MQQPWPGMLRGIWGDDERFVETYWSKVPGKYLAGDNARQDADGYYWIMGRIDDVLNVAGHRLSTIDIESALVTVLVSASGLTIMGVGSAFWGLIAGLVLFGARHLIQQKRG